MKKTESSGSENMREGSNASRFLPLISRQWAFAAGLILITVCSLSWSGYDALTIRAQYAQCAQCAQGPVRLAASANRVASFDLSFRLIPRKEILSGGPPKDGIPAISHPKVVPAADANYLKGGDRVIGVVIDGVARAYPLRILNWHENVNDQLGGTPIAVTYCPLCDSAVVFDRRVGGQIRRFGISGLLYNSNVLLYDRQPDAYAESLWSQLQMRAVTGPAAKTGLTLTPLHADLTTWADWKRRWPRTDVLSDRTGFARGYDRNPYAGYFRTDDIMFPVNPKPNPEVGLKNKDRLLVVRLGKTMRAYPVRAVARRSGPAGRIEDRLGDRRIRLTVLQEADSLRVEPVDDPNATLATVYTFWFAWQAMHPQTAIFGH